MGVLAAGGRWEEAEEASERANVRARRHRTSIVDIDIIIVHRKAGHVGSCATVGSIENAFYRPEAGRARSPARAARKVVV